jgi:hypothetical protein
MSYKKVGGLHFVMLPELSAPMSLGAWGDEGNVPESGKGTAIYQELIDLRLKMSNWQRSNKNDFANDEQIAKADRILELMDELSDELGEDMCLDPNQLTVSAVQGVIEPGSVITETVATRWWERLWSRIKHPLTPAPKTKLWRGVIVAVAQSGPESETD